MAQKKDGTPKVAKKVAKKAAVKKSAKTASAKAPPMPEAARATSSVPSYFLRLQDVAPPGFSYQGFVNWIWGLVWRSDRNPGDRLLYRQPLFTLTGSLGRRFDDLQSVVRRGQRSFALNTAIEQDAVRNFEDGPDTFGHMEQLLWDSSARADLRWFQLWALNDLDCLDVFAAPDDSVQGDIDFVVWVELLLMVEEVSDLFRGTNSDIWRGMEYSSWLTPQGPGLLLLKYLGEAAASGFKINRANTSFPQIYANNDFVADEAVLVKLREACCPIFGKVLEVLQSPAMESRFRAFFGGLARELNVSPEELWNAMYGMSKSSCGDDSYMPLLVAKVGQVFGLLKDYDETPLTLTDALEKWVGWIRGEPKGGWPVGKKYEAKANAERLKLVADAQRKGRVEAPERAKKRIF